MDLFIELKIKDILLNFLSGYWLIKSMSCCQEIRLYYCYRGWLLKLYAPFKFRDNRGLKANILSEMNSLKRMRQSSKKEQCTDHVTCQVIKNMMVSHASFQDISNSLLKFMSTCFNYEIYS